MIDNKIIGTPLMGGPSYEMPKDHSVSMLMFGLQPDLMDYLKKDIIKFFENEKDLENCEYYLPNVLTDMINKKICKVRLIKTNSVWKGITYKTDLDELKKYINDEINKGVYPEDLYN